MCQNDSFVDGVRGNIPMGKTPEEQLIFWNKMQTWLAQPEGKAWLAFMQKDFEGLYDHLMSRVPSNTKPEELWHLLGKVQQQNAAFTFPANVRQRIRALQVNMRGQ